jgi:hypothetical protein
MGDREQEVQVQTEAVDGTRGTGAPSASPGASSSYLSSSLRHTPVTGAVLAVVAGLAGALGLGAASRGSGPTPSMARVTSSAPPRRRRRRRR